MKRLLDAAIGVCLVAALSPSCVFALDKVRDTAPELGRLFFTAAERDRLEQDRGRVPDRPNPDTPRSVSVSGLIARSGQPSLPVINGKVVFPGDNPSGLRIRGSADGRVAITPPDGPDRVAKPGQSVDLATGEIREKFELPGRRDARKAEIPLHTPYITGTVPKADTAPVPQAKKARRPRRGSARRGAAPPPKPAPDGPPPPAPKVAPASAPAPAIPAPLPRQP
jgi:hypothetical protein